MNMLKFRRSLQAWMSVLVACHLLAGCALFVAGAVVGAGAFTYVNGELTRSYQATYGNAFEASKNALSEMNISVKSIEKQGLTTVIQGDFDGKPVTVNISRVDVGITEIGVRSGYVGVWDKGFSTEIHEKIAQRLRT